MTTKKLGIIILALCFCFHLIPFGAQATLTSEATKPIVTENDCSLTISYCYGETAFADVQVKLYRIADVSADCRYTLTPNFAESALPLNGVSSNREWNVIRSTLEAYILSAGITPDAVSATDENGQVCFAPLSAGMYLAVVGLVTQDTLRCRFDSALVALPGIGQDGNWQYAVAVNAKPEALPPVEPDEEKEFKVLKLWKGDEEQTDRPESIEVEIFRDSVLCETVVLSEETHWTYTWSAKDDGAIWSVAEKNVPQGYTMTVEEKDTAFVLTNTRIPTDPDDPGDSPPTGDTTNIMLYVVLMTISGAMLIVLGIVGKRTTV